MGKIVIYGGTFNPPHKGHTESAGEVVQQLKPDKLLVIPSGTPPHKSLTGDTPTGAQRLDMARLAFASVDGAEVSDVEVARDGISYTADTLRLLREREPDGDFTLMIGTDMFLSIEQWKDSDEILRTVSLAVTLRFEDSRDNTLAHAAHLRDKYGTRVEIIENRVIEVSSSELRERLENRFGEDFIDDSVYSYIIYNKLYGAKANLDWLRVRAHAMLNPSRVPHVIGCEQEAERLAVRWGEDINSAREAAILHDCTKRLTLEQQLKLCDKYGVVPDELELNSEKLLHSKTAAALAFAEFNVSDAVREAIAWHTTGRAGMSALEKIIYLADYIEPTRNFDGVEALRALSYDDMDKAMVMGLEMSRDDIVSRGITPHPGTLEALAELTKL
ncbi:MAG: nicotinate (nicotinamide) nucleotide adenylyltransferase [Oscillospiraceae bacterium]|jgi:nicotinate-nucleotide adenylyltransferase|nr:nicotinate (nicotinamide) nucleotide adenylyltransferase [Oscillospiraceae bacterium]